MKKYYVEKGHGKTLKFRCMHAMEPWTDNPLLADKFTIGQAQQGFAAGRIAWPVEHIDAFRNSVFTTIKRFALDSSQP
jgi:hypothetical protein